MYIGGVNGFNDYLWYADSIRKPKGPKLQGVGYTRKAASKRKLLVSFFKNTF